MTEEKISIAKLEMEIDEIKDKIENHRSAFEIKPGTIVGFLGLGLIIIGITSIGAILLIVGIIWVLFDGNGEVVSKDQLQKYKAQIKARRNLIVKMKDEGISYITRKDVITEEKKFV